ncbi:MAG TPA: anthranilate phosphoribosyltransferase [Cyclobacteriaceae bacterium]|nr:anthranilate phosphoribosyltransferase [Cyclobacteriaceae bacterium]
MKEILNDLFEYKSLDKSMAKEILKNLAQGVYNNSQVASFLTVYLMRSITVDELEGFREAMLELCVPVSLADYDPIDLCGTGGDGKDTFNISTLSAFVVAGAGVKVAKHGNNSVSSVCGSSNVLNYYGCKFTNDQDKLRKSIEGSGMAYLHAPLFHPAMKNVAPVRKELGVKTFFNILGPMVNPAFVKKQLVGVFSLEMARLYGYLYQRLGSDFIIVHSLDGYDEISLTGPIKFISKEAEKIIRASDLGLNPVTAQSLKGGSSVEGSSKLFLNVLEGNGTKEQNDVVTANAGLAIYCADNKISIPDAMMKARESLVSGSALKAFKKFLELNNN